MGTSEKFLGPRGRLLDAVVEGVAHVLDRHGAAVDQAWLVAESACGTERGADEQRMAVADHLWVLDPAAGVDPVAHRAVALDAALQGALGIGRRLLGNR